MPRILIVSAGLLVVLAVASQLAIPPLAERSVAHRLERDGGNAKVSVSAFPALRLLFSDGRSLEVDGHGLRLPVEEEGQGFDRIDGFGRVRIELEGGRAGPLAVDSLLLTRAKGERDYRLTASGTTTPREAGRFLGGPLGELGAGALLGEGDLPVSVEATIQNRDGEPRAVDTTGTVAGIPAGPIAEIVIDSVLRGL